MAQTQNAVDEILKVKKPLRITIGRVGKILGCKALLEKHLDKLPQTKAYLESITEAVEDFQIRRIEWAITELNDKGENIQEWKILRLAGLRENLSDKVRITLEQELRSN